MLLINVKIDWTTAICDMLCDKKPAALRQTSPQGHCGLVVLRVLHKHHAEFTAAQLLSQRTEAQPAQLWTSAAWWGSHPVSECELSLSPCHQDWGREWERLTPVHSSTLGQRGGDVSEVYGAVWMGLSSSYSSVACSRKEDNPAAVQTEYLNEFKYNSQNIWGELHCAVDWSISKKNNYFSHQLKCETWLFYL